MPSPSYVPVIATGRDIAFQDATVEGELSVGGTTSFTGEVTADSNVTVHGTLNVTGTTSLAAVTEGDTTVDGTITVLGETDLQGLTVHQPASMNDVFAANVTATQFTNSGTSTLTGYTEMTSGQTSGVFNVFDGTAGALNLGTPGGGIAMKGGANARVGQAVLVGGTIDVANTSVTANTKIFVSRTTLGGTPGHLSTVQTAGTGFTINSSEAADTSTVVWLLIEVS